MVWMKLSVLMILMEAVPLPLGTRNLPICLQLFQKGCILYGFRIPAMLKTFPVTMYPAMPWSTGILTPPHPVPADTAGSLLDTKAPVLTPLNGAMLSACSSNQLSADAIINNRFNGAFTHYLIENLMEYPNKPLELIVDLVDVDLTQNGYDQNPHIEGLLQDRKFFL